MQLESDNGSPMAILSGEEDDCEPSTSYSVKLVNPDHKSDYRVKKWRTNVKINPILSKF